MSRNTDSLMRDANQIAQDQRKAVIWNNWLMYSTIAEQEMHEETKLTDQKRKGGENHE